MSPSNQAYVAAFKADKQSSSIQSWEFVFPLHFIYWRRSLSDLSLSAGVVFCFRPEISRIPAGLFLCKAHKFGRGNLWQNCRKQQQHRQARPFVNQGKLQSFQHPVDTYNILPLMLKNHSDTSAEARVARGSDGKPYPHSCCSWKVIYQMKLFPKMFN